MNIQNHLKRPLALLLTGALTASSVMPACAINSSNGSIDINPDQEQTQGYTYTAPTEPVAVDDNVITASAHRAASPILGMMGVNATSGFGMINGGAPADLNEAQNCAALGIWGTSMNENPDPYYWNYFYNFYAEENDLPVSSDALINDNVAASPAQADSTLKEEYGNVSVSLSTRPDILVGCAAKGGAADDVSGYDEQLATINSFAVDSEFYQEGDETYSPKLVSYQMTYIKQMIESVKRLADAITEVEEETGKTTRYGDVQVIASDYEKYVYGVIAYVQEELAAKGLEEKTVAVLTSINEDGTYTLADSLATSSTSVVRAYEYAMCVSNSLVDLVGSTTVTLDQLLSADVIISINNNNITKTQLEQSFGANTYDGVLITNTPATLYGMTMNSVENAMGYAYVIGSMYSDELNIDPVELCAYFYQHFWHISDLNSLATVVKTNFSETILPDGVTGTLSSNYSAATVEAKLTKGMNYFMNNSDAFTSEEYQLIGMDEWQVDLTSGIGADISTNFTDVPADAYYAVPVAWAANAGIVYGMSETTYEPLTTVTRAQVVTFLWRAAGSPEPTTTTCNFTDVNEDDWYYTAVLWAVENGVTSGTSATTFSPNLECNRATFVTLLWNAEDQPETSAVNPFVDVVAGEGVWYYTAVLWAVENGVTAGTSATTFSPDAVCNRGQAVTFLYNKMV